LQTMLGDAGGLWLALVFGLIAALEVNAIAGKTGPIASVKGVIHMGVLLTAVLYVLAELAA